MYEQLRREKEAQDAAREGREEALMRQQLQRAEEKERQEALERQQRQEAFRREVALANQQILRLKVTFTMTSMLYQASSTRTAKSVSL